MFGLDGYEVFDNQVSCIKRTKSCYIAHQGKIGPSEEGMLGMIEVRFVRELGLVGHFAFKVF